jgi:hypothetical protein
MYRFLLTGFLFFNPFIYSYGQDATGAQFTFLTPRAHDFGSVYINSNSSYKFEFKNTGKTPLIIKSINGSPKGLNSPNYKMIISYSQSPVMPGMLSAIEVTFKAQGDTGIFKNQILITSNATPDKFPLLYISGIIIPEFAPAQERVPSPAPPEFSEQTITTNTK